MTIPDLSLYSNLGFALDTATANLQKTELQLAGGKRVNQPSDDPAAFSRAELLGLQQASVTNDVSLAANLQNKMTTIDGALSNAGNALDAAIQQATQGADGSINAQQMTTLAASAQGLLAQLVQAGNLQYGGAYVFGGTQTLNPPYSQTGVYGGNNSVNTAKLSDGTSIQTTFAGQSILGDNASGAIGALTALVAALQSGDQAAVAATLPQLQTALSQIAQARSTTGVQENFAATASTDGNSNLVTIAGAINDAVGFDIARGAANLQEQSLQIQALVSLGTALAKIPLINILA
jgi:flagellar hook-associated protein 3 FlgL